jgi:hypothetical protein
MSKLCRSILPVLLLGCTNYDTAVPASPSVNPIAIDPIAIGSITEIPLPEGYQRIETSPGSFGEWLRNISLKKDNHVYLYDGQLKRNQSLHFAILDISVGDKDLQQCADAVMRLRAEYLYSQRRYNEIEFRDYADKSYKWTGGDDRPGFERYLERVFAQCGSASLEKQLKPIALKNVQPGDVLIKGGFPGHAMIVTDVAIDKKGNKIIMLAQSYMPAQDIHIVKNMAYPELSPWYQSDGVEEIETPEWIFTSKQLRRWE